MILLDKLHISECQSPNILFDTRTSCLSPGSYEKSSYSTCHFKLVPFCHSQSCSAFHGGWRLASRIIFSIGTWVMLPKVL